MEIRNFRPEDSDQVISLIAEFRVFLSSLKAIPINPNLREASKELDDYLSPEYVVFVAVLNNEVLGYLVCRINQDVVWAESLFVKPSVRRKGIGSALYSQAERLARELKSETVYNWIHPNNDAIIQFLKRRGYSVLNLIELRRPRSGEETFSIIQVDGHQFKY